MSSSKMKILANGFLESEKNLSTLRSITLRPFMILIHLMWGMKGSRGYWLMFMSLTTSVIVQPSWNFNYLLYNLLHLFLKLFYHYLVGIGI